VLGEGGFLVAPVSFLQELRELATRYGIVLIIDEVQSGFGRTGAMFACQTFGVTPDLMAVAKSLAAGMPLAAVVGRADLMDTIQPGALGGTYGGNPLAAVAALQAIRIIEETLASGHVDRLASRLRAQLDDLAARVPVIGEVRGLGAMLAIELVRDRVTKDPAVAETAAIVADARAHGLLLLPAGTYGNVIRFLMPLTTPLDVLDEGLRVLERALTAVRIAS
jgi:4-aminobutyrate aminotransferase/(S)-3-amino-2-methylpropionate transaminase